MKKAKKQKTDRDAQKKRPSGRKVRESVLMAEEFMIGLTVIKIS